MMEVLDYRGLTVCTTQSECTNIQHHVQCALMVAVQV